MNIRNMIARFVWTLLMLAMLAACGGMSATRATPATTDTIPIPPKATPLAVGTNPLADSVADGYRKAVGQKNIKVDVQLYTVPNDMSWEQVQSFYQESLKADWKLDANQHHDAGVFKSISWTRSESPNRQGVAIGYGPASGDTPPFLMVAQFSEQPMSTQ